MERTTPETYLGYLRLERPGGVALDRVHRYRFPASLLPDEVAFGGRWRVEAQRALAQAGARLRLRFRARHVYLVLGGAGRVAARVDGRLRHVVRVGGTPRLYTLLDFPALHAGLLELRFTPGISAYAFTFG
jgi:hypothetical protein